MLLWMKTDGLKIIRIIHIISNVHIVLVYILCRPM